MRQDHRVSQKHSTGPEEPPEPVLQCTDLSDIVPTQQAEVQYRHRSTVQDRREPICPRWTTMLVTCLPQHTAACDGSCTPPSKGVWVDPYLDLDCARSIRQQPAALGFLFRTANHRELPSPSTSVVDQPYAFSGCGGVKDRRT